MSVSPTTRSLQVIQASVFYAGCPVHAPDGHRIGTVCLIDKKPRSFSSTEEKTLKDFAALVDDELASAAKMNVDELTKIANRRGFLQVARHLLPLCVRNKMDVELLFFDLDGFKALNDKFGHKAGDEALQTFAELLLKGFRDSDVVARLGGDEFAVMIAGQSVFADPALARMRTLAKDEKSDFNQDLDWSVGQVRFDPDSHINIEDLLSAADERMYEQKKTGKPKGSD